MYIIKSFKIFLAKISKSYFLKDLFIWMSVILGILFNVAFFYLLKIKIGGDISSIDSSFSGIGYDFILNGEKVYNVPIFIAIFSLFNILIARILYGYDLLASYILITAIPVLNGFYFFSTFLFLSAVRV